MPMTTTTHVPSFQTKLFAAATLAAATALAVAGTLFATTMARRTDERIEQTLVAEAKLAADLLARGAGPVSEPIDRRPHREFDAEADRLGALLDARVTLIARDGRVLGDSAETPTASRSWKTTRARPEIVAGA